MRTRYERTGIGDIPLIGILLLFPILVYASQYGFSFEHGYANTAAGFATKGLGASFTSGEALALRVQLVLVYGIVFACIAPYFRGILHTILNYIPIALLILLTVASIGWSHAPKHAIMSVTMIVIDVCFAVYLTTRFEPESLIRLLSVAGLIVVVSSLFLVMFMPQYGIQGRGDAYSGAWQGIFGSKNFIGEELTYLTLPVFFMGLRGLYWRGVLFAYTGVVVLITIKSQSTGSMLLLGSSLAFVFLLKFLSRLGMREASVSVLVIATGACISAIVGFEFRDMILPMLGKDSTMTGRTLIWGTLIMSLLKSPFVGYGYDSFWVGAQESANVAASMNSAQINYAENGLLEMALGLGLIGLVLYVLTFIGAVRNALFCFRRNPSNVVMWHISTLFVVSISNIASGYVFTYTNLQCLLPLVAYFGLKREAQKIRAAQAAESQIQRVTTAV